jgi:hypothetical protein
MALHLYGVVRAGMSLPAGGEDSVDLSAVRHEDLAVVVSPLDEDVEPTDEDAVRHLDVLTGLVLAGPVLPLRFGTVAPDERSAREEVLACAAEELRAQLDAVDGLVELRLDLSFDEQTGLREVVAEDPSLREPANPGARLPADIERGERIVRQLAQWRRARADALLSPLLKKVEASVRLDEPAPTVDRVALLCRLEQLDAVDDGVAQLGQGDHPPAVEYVGPLPVFSFLEQLAGPGAGAEPAPEGSRWGW